MSEKLDGVRAYWDGEKLLSRGGKEFVAPIWFTKDFPLFCDRWRTLEQERRF